MRNSTILSRVICRLFLIVVSILLSLIPICYAAKTDVVILKNGDKITGEIKKLWRGQLEYSTDDMKRVYIEWIKIARLSSKYRYDIELEEGQRYFGAIGEASKDGKMVVITDTEQITVELIAVVRITPLEATFFQRLKGYLDLGFGYQKANSLITWTAGAEVTYHSRKWEAKVDGDSYYSDDEQVESTARNSLGLQFVRFLLNKWSIMAFARGQQNTELDLDLRAFVGGGVGRYLIQTNQMLLLLGGGLDVTSEKYTDAESAQWSPEVLAVLDFQAFRHHSPELDLTTSLMIFANIRDLGRFRIEFDGRLRLEIFKDFFWGVGIFDHFDSRPPVQGTTKNDYSPTKNDFGIDTTISWKFN